MSNEREICTMLVPFKIEMLCETCEDGYMMYSPSEYNQENSISEYETPSCRHICETCAIVEYFDVAYPYIDYMNAEDIDDELNLSTRDEL